MKNATGTTQTDNDRCRVTHWHFDVGADGETSKAEMKTGQSYFRKKGVHHNVINANEFEFAFVEIEYK